MSEASQTPPAVTDAIQKFGRFLARARARLATIDWRAKRREGRHLALAIVAFAVGWGLFQWGDGERSAALHGDARVLAARRAIRAALHWDDGVSVLEHALAGLGMAFAGMMALQLFYWGVRPIGDGDSATPIRVRALLGLPLAFAMAALGWHVAYGKTGALVAAAVVLAIGWCLLYPERLQRLAIVTPARFIALTGGLLWLNFDLAWKLDRWPTTHDSATTVLLHLLAGGTTLLVASAAIGWLTKRVRLLRPT
ncbi:hypothetical protein [Burkholderia gladioli]|uniref:hypothetical protein n=1 Tax=Burkholderia gladioli TaxID=28095 RepID=UPI0016404223|nr:hypothetical protein [Burkholderia gladioli]